MVQAGLDSLGALELRNALHQETGISLPATFAFDHPTIASMASFLAANDRASSAPFQPQPMESERTEHRAHSSVQAQDLRPLLQTMIKDILGADVDANQPLMEVHERAGLI